MYLNNAKMTSLFVVTLLLASAMTLHVSTNSSGSNQAILNGNSTKSGLNATIRITINNTSHGGNLTKNHSQSHKGITNKLVNVTQPVINIGSQKKQNNTQHQNKSNISKSVSAPAANQSNSVKEATKILPHHKTVR